MTNGYKIVLRTIMTGMAKANVHKSIVMTSIASKAQPEKTDNSLCTDRVKGWDYDFGLERPGRLTEQSLLTVCFVYFSPKLFSCVGAMV